jgi:DNA-directed RNA polymerase beta' subunit
VVFQSTWHLNLFRPFVISKNHCKELAYNIRGANKLIEDGIPEVWAILEEVIKGKVRAPQPCTDTSPSRYSGVHASP